MSVPRPPANSYEALIPNMAVCGHRVFEEIKVRPFGWDPNPKAWYPYGREADTRAVHTKKACEETGRKCSATAKDSGLGRNPPCDTRCSHPAKEDTPHSVLSKAHHPRSVEKT